MLDTFFAVCVGGGGRGGCGRVTHWQCGSINQAWSTDITGSTQAHKYHDDCCHDFKIWVNSRDVLFTSSALGKVTFLHTTRSSLRFGWIYTSSHCTMPQRIALIGSDASAIQRRTCRLLEGVFEFGSDHFAHAHPMDTLVVFVDNPTGRGLCCFK